MPPLPPFRNLVLASLGCALLSAAVPAAEGPPPPPPSVEAIQMLADVTLIDGECRNIEVNFGRAFQAAGNMGVNAVDVMPTGALRAAFEAAARKRFAETSHEDLCDAVARAYIDSVPGIMRLR